MKFVSDFARVLGLRKEEKVVPVNFILGKSISYCLNNSCFDKGNICCTCCDNLDCSYKCERTEEDCEYNRKRKSHIKI